MAIPSGLNPILATNLPLSLSAPRGVNVAVDALRLSLLGVGAIHQAFLIAKQGQKSLSQTSSMLNRARTLREAAQVMLEAASRDPQTAKHDAAMAAGATNALIDVSGEHYCPMSRDTECLIQIFFGGLNWRANFDLVKRLIEKCAICSDEIREADVCFLGGVVLPPSLILRHK